MKWYTYIICAVLIIIGSFCTVELVNIFDVQSGEYGTVFVYETPYKYDEFSRFDFGRIDFDSQDYQKYQSITVHDSQEFDGTKNNYTLFFNDQPLNHVVQTAGRISGDLAIKFYDLDGQIITTADLNFVIEYQASNTKVTITITNVNDSVSYLNTYMEINGAILRVVNKAVAV